MRGNVDEDMFESKIRQQDKNKQINVNSMAEEVFFLIF